MARAQSLARELLQAMGKIKDFLKKDDSLGDWVNSKAIKCNLECVGEAVSPVLGMRTMRCLGTSRQIYIVGSWKIASGDEKGSS